MTIPEAIAWLEAELIVVSGLSMQNRMDALKLGVEALKAWEFAREHSGMSMSTILPGETVE